MYKKIKNIELQFWKLPKSHTWYFYLIHTHRHRKERDVRVQTEYSCSTPMYIYDNDYWSILPGIEFHPLKYKSVHNAGPQFYITVSWLKWRILLFSRKVDWTTEEDVQV